MTIAVVTLGLLLAMMPGIGFSYWVEVNKDPLTNPIEVSTVESNRIALVNGQVVVMKPAASKYLELALQEASNRVELDSTDPQNVKVFVQARNGICGTGRPSIVLPLFRQEYNRYRRQLLGTGTIERPIR